MRKSLSVLLSSTLILQTVFVNGVLAAPALTTANVNFRQGPGTNFGSLGNGAVRYAGRNGELR